MTRSTTALSAMVCTLGLTYGCSSTNTVTADAGGDAGANDSQAPEDQAADSGGGDAQVGEAGGDGPAGEGGTGVLGFTPSNVDLTGMDLSKVGDIIISGANCGIINPEGPTPWDCADATKVASKIITLPDQSRMAIFVVKSLRIEASALMVVSTGHIPLAVVALDTITLLGSVQVPPGLGGGAFNSMSDMKGSGPGGGGGGPASQKAAGGGASFCGVGGQGTAETGGTPYAKSTAYGTPELIPLVGGSAGGAGAVGANSAGGGGAIQFVAGTSITLMAGAYISAPGGGGPQGGLATTQEASGGGSGGAILLEAPTVTIAGTLAANGGGGGEGAGGNASGGANGDDGHNADATAAAGGAAGTGNHGGTGGAGDTASGGNAVSDGTASASGGGGGVGRIRINTSTGSAVLTGGTATPSAVSTCFTQGTLKK
jgi:hypothetical protein